MRLVPVSKRRIVDRDSRPTLEQQRGLDAYELHLRENPESYICSLLHFAVARGDDQLLEYALAHGLREHGNVHFKDPQGRQPIEIAMQKEHIPNIEKLIQHGAEVDFTNFMKSLVRRNRVSILEGLLQSRLPDRLISSSHLFTIYDTALSARSWIAVRVILSSPRFFFEVALNNDECLQLYAAKLLFSDQRAWEDHQSELESILDLLLNLGLNIDLRWPATSAKQESWLHIMADKGFLAPLEPMLERGADINALDWEGRTPLMRAVARVDPANVQSQIVQVVHTLIGRGASLHAGNSIWSMTWSSGFWILFDILVSSVHNISHVDRRGLTLLHYAVEASNHDHLDLLLSKCCLIINHSAPNYGTPLSVACRKEDWQAALKLATAGSQCTYHDVRAMLNSSKSLRPHLLQALDHTPVLVESSKADTQNWVALLTRDVLANCDQESDLQTLDRLSRWLPSWLKNGHDIAEALNMHSKDLPAACQLQACRILLTNRTNPNAYINSAKTMTLLDHAIDQQLFDCAIELLKAGADPNVTATQNQPPLDRVMRAVAHGPEEKRNAAIALSIQLREMGAKQDQPDPTQNLKPVLILDAASPSSASDCSTTTEPSIFDTTPTSSFGTSFTSSFPHGCITPGTPSSIDFNENHIGTNTLHSAILAKDASMVYFALSAGIDPNIPNPVTNDFPVVLALVDDVPDVLSILLSRYFQYLHPSPSPNGTITATGIVDPNGAEHPDLNWPGSYPRRDTGNVHLPRDTLTYLMAAALKGSIGCVKAFLEADAKVNVRAYNYKTVLHLIASAQPLHYVEMTEMIVRRGGDVFAEERVHNLTPLHIAVYRKDAKLLEALLSSTVFKTGNRHARRDTRVYGCGLSPLDLAHRTGFLRGVDLLIKAWVNMRGGRRNLAL